MSQNNYNILIKHGTIINPAGDSSSQGKFDVLIKDGVVAKIAQNLHGEDGFTEIINAEGQIVSPGFVDTHVHLRDPGQTHKEDILTGARAAKHGGYTSVVIMASL